MTIDVSALAPEARAHYLVLGERVTTPRTLAQANRTIRAFRRFGAEVTDHGYGPDDNSYLVDTRDTLLARHTERSDAMGVSKLATVTHDTAQRNAKDERLSVRSLLTSCVTRLMEGGKVLDAQRIRTLLKQTSAAPDDDALLDHMARMHTMLNEPVLTPFIAGRGGPSVLVRLQTSRDNLLAAIRDRASHPEVTAVSEERNILDGIIVVNTRNAYNAARVAARRLGQPAIATAFKLVHFRRGNAPIVDDEPETEPGTEPGTEI